MDRNIIIEIEERLNRPLQLLTVDAVTESFAKYDSKIFAQINSRMENGKIVPAHQTTIYEDVISYIKKMEDPRFLKKSRKARGTAEENKETAVKEAAFYEYAYIDKSTWSDMKHDQIKILKKTLLKLVFALNLDLAQAEKLLAKGGERFHPEDTQEKIILAIIDVRKFHPLTVDDIMDILAEYQKMYEDTHPFDSIYDTPKMIAERKKNSGTSAGGRTK